MAGGGGWFRVGYLHGEGAGLEPERVDGAGPAQAVRPSWSFVGVVTRQAGPGAPPPVLLGAARVALPGDCRDLLPSETHVLLLREAALEAWPVEEGPALGNRPVWRRELRPQQQPEEEEEAEGEATRARPALPAAPGGADATAAPLAGAELPLVRGGYVVPQPDFFRPLSPALRARQLALGHEHVLLLDAAGDVFAWGGGRHGQLGHGGLESAAEPRVVEALQGVPMGQVAAGGWHSASVSEAGDLYTWGWNESGQLGLPSKVVQESREAATVEVGHNGTPPGGPPAQCESPQASFISIQSFPALLDMPQGADVSKITCGSRHSAALTQTGDLYTWGWGKYGQLGHGTTATSDRPKRICCFEAWGLGVKDVVCGPWTTFVLALPPPSHKACS